MRNDNYHDGTKNIIISVVESQSDAPLERIRVSIFTGKYLLESGYSNVDGCYMSSLIGSGHYKIKVQNERDGSEKTAFVRLLKKTPIARKKIKLRINLKREKRKNNSNWNFDNDNWRSETSKKNDNRMFFFSSNASHKSKNFSGNSFAQKSSDGSFATWLHSKKGATAFVAAVVVLVVAISLILTFTLRGGKLSQFVLPDGSTLLLEYDQNGKLKLPAAPATDDAHGFDGWYLDAEGKIPFDPNSPNFPNGNAGTIVVYPVFHKHIYQNENGETAWEETSAPTCVVAGSKKAKCLHTNCKKEIFETAEINLDNHFMSVVPQYYHDMYGVKCQNEGCPHTIDMSTKGLAFELNADRNGYIVSDKVAASDTDIIIPPTHNDPSDPEATLAVVGIRKDAFSLNRKITSVKIPSSVTTINASAFAGCNNLTTITFAKGSRLTTIEETAFSACSSLTDIEIPSSVTTINASAFASCNNLTTITFAKESQLATIGDSAFSGCSSLTDIEIPSSVTTIGAYAFTDCTNLITITFAEDNKLATMGSYVVASCTSLTTIFYNKTMAAWYKASKNHIYNEQTNSSFVIFCSDGILTKYSTF